MATITSLIICVTAVVLLNIPGDRCVEIIGGKEAKQHSWPFLALVHGDGKLCGGSLIKQQWVLTAAHCKGMIKVTLGVHSLTQEEETQDFTVKQISVHPKFNNKTRENDLMLLKLNAPAKITKNVKVHELPREPKDMKPKTVCKAAGWGITKVRTSKRAKKLMEVEIRVMDRKQCQKEYYKNIKITDNMLCAWDKKGGKDTCKGDSGGPLICDKELTAVVSFGKECGKAPGVYTQLTKEYVKWILEVTGGAE